MSTPWYLLVGAILGAGLIIATAIIVSCACADRKRGRRSIPPPLPLVQPRERTSPSQAGHAIELRSFPVDRQLLSRDINTSTASKPGSRSVCGWDSKQSASTPTRAKSKSRSKADLKTTTTGTSPTRTSLTRSSSKGYSVNATSPIPHLVPKPRITARRDQIEPAPPPKDWPIPIIRSPSLQRTPLVSPTIRPSHNKLRSLASSPRSPQPTEEIGPDLTLLALRKAAGNEVPEFSEIGFSEAPDPIHPMFVERRMAQAAQGMTASEMVLASERSEFEWPRPPPKKPKKSTAFTRTDPVQPPPSNESIRMEVRVEDTVQAVGSSATPPPRTASRKGKERERAMK